MKMTLKQGIAVMIGVAGVGIVGAQALVSEPDPIVVESAADMTSPPVDMTTPLIVDAAPEPAPAPEPVIVAPEPAPAVQMPAPVRTAPVVIELPRSVSPRSGEGSGEEIATRTAPVDERAGSSPLYQVDQSPGL
jgi:hypothetical protein